MLSTVPGSPLTGLQAVDARWQHYCRGEVPCPTVVTAATDTLPTVDWDVIICGGTLGVMVAAALAQRQWRVALVERGELRGRAQEWNISRHELDALTRLGLLTEAELEAAIASAYNPGRIQFAGGNPLWVRDVLNIGVDPQGLLATLKQTFLAAGGTLLEHTPFQAVTVHPNGVTVTAGQPLTARLMIDAMGHFSPVALQARGGQRPDGMCVVVGSCAQGYPANDTGDLIVSFTPLQQQCQYFWEAFPARDGRTTYMFSYLDADPRRPALTDFFEEYWRLLPEYQQVERDQLQVQRGLFGFFPCYRASPLRYPWGRLLAVGDSSGSQSPLSFGGFGALIRHLERLTLGLHDALTWDCLDAFALGQLQPYQPSLSVTWLFQKSMTAAMDQALPAQRINDTLAAIFADMAYLGEPTLKPFLQDVVQFPALARTLLTTSLRHPRLVAQLLPQVGIGALVPWLGHYGALAAYSALTPLAQSLSPLGDALPPVPRYYSRRWLDALRYGSGSDYRG